jgi:transposase InsO family protein
VKANEDLTGKNRRALVRHSAVSWIIQCQNQGGGLGECIQKAAQLDWQGRHFSPRSLEEWYYAHRQSGFAGLEGQERRADAGRQRAMSPQLAAAILELRQTEPRLTLSAILERLDRQGLLGPETGCSRSTIYRFLQRQGLDRQRLRALSNEVGGPTKAWESRAPNALWMSDVMDGPSLKNAAGKAERSWLIATLDDHSRLIPHAQFYSQTKITQLLDCLRQAFERRGVPEALYTDQGKIFTGHQLKLVCANLGIRLLHARPYAAWSKGKIERFFRTLQEAFFPQLHFEPISDLAGLNQRLWQWIEHHYHDRPHAALNGHTPRERFSAVAMRALPENFPAPLL